MKNNEFMAKSELVEGTFMWAVEQMSKGIKMTQKSKADWWFCCFNLQCTRTLRPKVPGSGNEVDWDLYSQELSYFDFIATDWEVFEEKFGKFKVGEKGSISFGGYSIDKKHFSDLKRALKKAEESN